MKTLFEIFFIILVSVLLFIAFLYGTSAECWYAGEHDALHEGQNCHCYERFVKGGK